MRAEPTLQIQKSHFPSELSYILLDKCLCMRAEPTLQIEKSHFPSELSYILHAAPSSAATYSINGTTLSSAALLVFQMLSRVSSGT
jgi:hypothetical protein